MNRGIFTWFYNHGCEYLLADTPDIIMEILRTTSVNRKKGIHITKEIKNTGLLWSKELLYTPEDGGEDDPEAGRKMGISKIYSIPLL